MSDSYSLPAGTPNVYLDTGEQVYEFDATDFGVQPPYTKEEMEGLPVIIRGVSADTFEGDFGEARSILHNWPNEDSTVEPWGAFFSENSAVIQQVKKAVAQGRVPFVAVLRMKKSEQHKGQTYWTLEKWMRDPNVPIQNPADKYTQG